MTNPLDGGELAAEAEKAPTKVDSRGGRDSTVVALLKNPQGLICLIYLALLILVAIFAPLIAPYGVTETDILSANTPPGTPGHILGADAAGYDIFSRLVWGSRQTLTAVVIIVSVSASIGVIAGLFSGFYRGKLETVSNFVADSLMSLPAVVLLIAMYAFTGPNLPMAMAVYGVIVAPTFYRLVKSTVVSVRNELYVDAARVTGISDIRIILRHVLWAVRAPAIIQGAFIMAAGISMEAGISFIGLGNPAGASWGMTLQRSFNSIYNNPLAVVWPSLVICLTILSFVLLGNALSDVLQSSARSTVLSPRRKRAEVAAALARLEQSGTADADAGQPRELSSSDDVLLAIRDLRIAYPIHGGGLNEVVHGVDFDLRRGEIHGLVGESGSGKSQIAFSTLGILPKEAVVLSGSVLLGNEDLMADPGALTRARGRRIGYVPQEPMSNLDPSFTIGVQLVRGLRSAKPMSKRAATDIVIALLKRVGIADAERVMKLYPHEISGGMAQRVLICGAIAPEPDIIVADEPTTALDVTVQAEVLQILRDLSQERGLAMILVTHNLGVVADLCHTVTVMKDGNFVERADVETLFASPQEPYTQELLASSRSVELMEI
ncbi:dipeptide/oligopeptide/nickel ABC transporter permease/ATP-binding protein [Demequina sp.]|uniref:dipeptide/oligopeptide/nickel ABC transporter permease/ATP-binding protein n=1 Tax=Demequina sp. TaxID=2050685 RepID=UPI003A899B2E